MEHFITLFDKKFLPQGMALHASMLRTLPDFTLWILCLDDECYEILNRLQLKNVNLIILSQHETPELLAVKSGRSAAEYCWTLTPFAPRIVFDIDHSIKRVTYLDADLWFLKNPSVIFDDFERSGKHVMITSHGYAPEYDQSEMCGQYCVQYMVFNNSKESESVRMTWQEQCIEWCFARFEDGRFGDQKYLDAWPINHAAIVHVMTEKAWALAPWNSIRYPYGEAIFHHFQGFRIINRSKYVLGHYAIPKATFNSVYKPYLLDIADAIQRLLSIGISLEPQSKEIRLSKIQRFKKIISNLVFFRWRYSPTFDGRLPIKS